MTNRYLGLVLAATIIFKEFLRYQAHVLCYRVGPNWIRKLGTFAKPNVNDYRPSTEPHVEMNL